jgi:hypothetical protein
MELGSLLGPHSQHICPSIQTKSKEQEVYLHPHYAPQKIPMANHRMEHHHPRINTNSPIVLEVVTVET